MYPGGYFTQHENCFRVRNTFHYHIAQGRTCPLSWLTSILKGMEDTELPTNEEKYWHKSKVKLKRWIRKRNFPFLKVDMELANGWSSNNYWHMQVNKQNQPKRKTFRYMWNEANLMIAKITNWQDGLSYIFWLVIHHVSAFI